MAYKRGHFDGVELLELIRMLIIKMEWLLFIWPYIMENCLKIHERLLDTLYYYTKTSVHRSKKENLYHLIFALSLWLSKLGLMFFMMSEKNFRKGVVAHGAWGERRSDLRHHWIQRISANDVQTDAKLHARFTQRCIQV